MREAALIALKTLLETITVANGYDLDIKHVSRQWKAVEDISDANFPAILIIDDGPEEIFENTGDSADVSFTISLIAYIKDAVNPSTALNLIDQNMKKAVYSDQTFAGTIQATRVQPYQPRDISSLPPYGWIDRPLEITYEGQHSSGL